MPKKNKLQKFEDILHYPNVFESYDRQSTSLVIHPDKKEVVMRGRWASDHFGNDNPVTLELACGKGDYSLALAHMHPDRNFIGVDIKGNRIWKGATIALEEDLMNVAFLRTRIENIEQHFAKDEISEIWITFPDPFPRKSRAHKRLTSPRFLETYRKFLKPGGLVKFKTDAEALFDWTLEVIEEDPKCKIETLQRDIYQNGVTDPELNIQTFYEKQHLEAGKKIDFLSMTIDNG